MTQQPFQPGYPAPQYAPQQYTQPPAPYNPGAPGPVQQQYPPAPPAQAPMGYPQQYAQPAQPGFPAQPPAPAGPPPATGTLDEFYSQPSVGGGPSISWTDAQNQPKPIGTFISGTVARDVSNGDIQQQTDFQTKAPLFYRDGRPKFSMKVPLLIPGHPEFPEGEGSWYVKGQARDELQRAMSAAGVTDGTPRGGDQVTITLVQRKPMARGMNPQNVVSVTYQRGAGQAPAPQAPAPAAQAAPQQVQQMQQAPVQQMQQAPVQQYQAPQYAPPAPVQQMQQAPAPAAQAAPPAPAGLTAEQQQLMSQLVNPQAG